MIIALKNKITIDDYHSRDEFDKLRLTNNIMEYSRPCIYSIWQEDAHLVYC